MILYRLRCERDHDFESWFRDSSAYDTQKAQGLVACPACGSVKVEKAIMAPALGRGTRAFVEETPVPQPAAPAVPAVAAPVALMGEHEAKLRALLRSVREHVVAHSDYVGPDFAVQARRMHEGEEEPRPIYGEATADEVRALIEDEIEVMPLPVLPDERN